MPPDPSSTGATPAMPNKKEERSDGGCVSGTTAPATEVGMYCPGAMTSDTGVSSIGNRRHPGDAQQEGGKVGLQLRERDDRTGNRGQHVLNRRADIRNRRHHISNRRHHDW